MSQVAKRESHAPKFAESDAHSCTAEGGCISPGIRNSLLPSNWRQLLPGLPHKEPLMDLIVMAARVEAFTANSGQALRLAQQGAGHPIRAHATGDLLHTAQVILQRSVLSTRKQPICEQRPLLPTYRTSFFVIGRNLAMASSHSSRLKIPKDTRCT